MPELEEPSCIGWIEGKDKLFVTRKRMLFRSTLRASRGSFACSGLMVLALALTGCRRPLVEPVPEPKREETLTPQISFSKFCIGCHGEDGRLGPAPILNDPIFAAIIPQDIFFDTVANGRFGHLMPAWSEEKGGTMNKEQIEQLTHAIRQWWGKPGMDTASIPSYAVTTTQGGGVPGDPSAGRTKFEHICGRCHGRDGRGKDAGALRSPAFLALASHQLIRRTMIIGRPDLGMPDYRALGAMSPSHQPLTSQDISDILAYILSWPEASMLQSGASTKETSGS